MKKLLISLFITLLSVNALVMPTKANDEGIAPVYKWENDPDEE